MRELGLRARGNCEARRACIGSFALAIVALALLTVFSGSVSTSLWNPEPVAALQKHLNGDIHLVAGGPNDGEPLANRVDFALDTNFRERGHVLVYADTKYIGAVDFGETRSKDSERRILYRLDTTRLENGPALLKFYLFNRDWSSVLAFATWTGVVENPEIVALTRIGSLVPVQLRGRDGDESFVLLVSSRPELLEQPPGTSGLAAHVLSNGVWSVRTREIVLNLDILFRIHGPDAKLVLWTNNELKGWARSRVIGLHELSP